MRKLKVYLDTSVISHLLQEDAPEKMADTQKLWELFRRGKYEVYLSTATLQEMYKCHEPKRSQLLEMLDLIEFKTLEITDEVSKITEMIIDFGILSRKHLFDCQHIAAAVANECDCIISWNFKHIVNIKTIRGVRAITNLEGYNTIEIWHPSVLLESEE